MKSGNRNLFRLTRFVLLKLPIVFKFLARFRKSHLRILIIKTDAIGDYILFRNYLELIRQSEKFKDYTITLLGNELWKELALEYDSKFADNFLFIKTDDLYYSPWNTFKLGYRLYKNNYGIVLQPSYTRLLVNDGLAALTAAKQIIGFCGDNEGIAPRYKTKTDEFYSKLIDLPAAVNFEFYRSAFFFETVLNTPVFLTSPTLGSFNKNAKHIVIFPGAGNSKRGWQKENFLEVIRLIFEHDPSFIVYIAGGNDETENGNYLEKKIAVKNVHNLTGKTSLLQLVEIIGNARLVISNETSAVHIASATKTPAVCILGGGHFGRFAPYPDNMAEKLICVYEKMECYNCNWNCKFETPPSEPFPCISTINIKHVWQQVLQILTV